MLYDAGTPAAFDSDAYYARLRNPAALSRATFPKVREPWRTVCSVARREGERAIGQAPTAEKDLRHGSDRQIERAVIAFFWSVADAKTARDRHAPSREIFALQHSVSKGDLLSVS